MLPSDSQSPRHDMLTWLSLMLRAQQRKTQAARQGALPALFGLMAITLLLPTAAWASFFDNSPGKLVRAHASHRRPSNCAKCHVTGKRDLDANKVWTATRRLPSA